MDINGFLTNYIQKSYKVLSIDIFPDFIIVNSISHEIKIADTSNIFFVSALIHFISE